MCCRGVGCIAVGASDDGAFWSRHAGCCVGGPFWVAKWCGYLCNPVFPPPLRAVARRVLLLTCRWVFARSLQSVCRHNRKGARVEAAVGKGHCGSGRPLYWPSGIDEGAVKRCAGMSVRAEQGARGVVGCGRFARQCCGVARDCADPPLVGMLCTYCRDHAALGQVFQLG